MFSQLFPHFIFMQRVVDALGVEMRDFIFMRENAGYDACSFELGACRVLFRSARVTPTKKGQFVVFWKRADDDSTIPYDRQDLFDVLVVSVVIEGCFGQFVFPKNELVRRGYVSINSVGGKRAMRVYSPDEIVESVQAKRTQAWQTSFFFKEQPNSVLDGKRICELYKFQGA